MQNNQSTSAREDVADSQIVADCLAKGKAVPPEVARRVCQQAELARAKLLSMHGVQNVGVEIIREIRGELPAS